MPSNAPGQKFQIGMLRDGAMRMTCREAGCEQERNGWAVVLDVAQPVHRQAARTIRDDRTRRHIEVASEGARAYLEANGPALGLTVTPGLAGLLERTPPGMAVFLFPPGQPCFREHLDREVVFVHRASERVRLHQRPQDFTEHFNEEADRVNRMIQRG